ncbi:hypothetical protein AB6A40_001295 [Gnathostoma spinigerum]|uniref:AMP-activated protein kinase glycogen-binding domain-containing protein n=1 Tax=Gnathostoma spinigerum TaxID=75299 RepID=A0ABD6E547_9BILA
MEMSLNEQKLILKETKLKNEELSVTVAEQLNTIAKLNNEKEKVLKEKDEIIRQLQSIEGSSEMSSEEISEKNRVIDNLNNQVDDLRRQLTNSNDRAASIENELNAALKDSEDKQRKLEELEAALAEKETEFEETSKRIRREAEAILSSAPPEAQELRRLQEKLHESQNAVTSLQTRLEDMRLERDLLKQQLGAQRSGGHTPYGSGAQTPQYQPMTREEDLTDLTNELMRTSRKSYELQEQVKAMESEAIMAQERIKYLESELRKNAEEIWIAKERIANQDRELDSLRWQLDGARAEADRRARELEEEKRKYIETGGVDYAVVERLKREADERAAKLGEEKSKVEWRLGEVTQFWNDAKWKVGELEAALAHRQWLLDQANQKVHELAPSGIDVGDFINQCRWSLKDAFLLRRQPCSDRFKWRLALWDDDSPENLKEYRRIWFEVHVKPEAKFVALSASFTNWECLLTMSVVDDLQWKRGVWVDIPTGRHEFSFLVDGQWQVSDLYPTCWNDCGTHNNWRTVE